MKKPWIFLLASCTLRASCAGRSVVSSSPMSEIPAKSSSNDSSTVSSSALSNSASSVPSGEVALPESAEFQTFWDYSSSVSVSLKFSNASLYALSEYGANDNQKWGDVYFPCDLTISVNGNQSVYPEAGARMKGNTSRRKIADSSGNISQTCHFKISLKATFDDPIYDLSQFQKFKHDWSADAAGLTARKKRNLYGMEKFDLKYLPRNEGKTLSQEVYCYDGFRSAGILAPHAKWASTTLQSDSSTKDFFYEIIEDIDKVFLKRHFSKAEAQGDLYKCLWGTDSSGTWSGANLARDGAVEKTYDSAGYTIGQRVSKGRIGVEDNYAGYHPNYQLKTNDDGEAANFSAMANYINALWNVRYQKAPQKTLESVLDVQEFLRFEALSYLYGNFDDQRNNANNYYLYFRPSDGKAIYLPYDWDWGLGADDGSGKLTMGTLTPLQTTGFAGEITTNVYWVTFFKSGSLSFDQSSYISTYKTAIQSLVDQNYLQAERYSALANQAPSALGHSEVTSVSSYISAKLKTTSANL